MKSLLLLIPLTISGILIIKALKYNKENPPGTKKPAPKNPKKQSGSRIK